ncbi:winged helix-turn-helix transcriptional regulator [Marinibacterium sp. SX1]|uniref:winged helix-turn-helix transcriptional regulator n=1 Tax=Marinibacterium sp. SX1 TaxID=3388424 RepID=UPI003D16A87E
MKPLPRHGDPRCPAVRNLLQTVGSKWSVIVVLHLSRGPHRFSDLRRSVGGVTQKSLTACLRELERNGLVARKVTPSIPPRVDYALTDLGETLMDPLLALTTWAVSNEGAVAAAQARFAAGEEDSAAA